MSGFILDGIIKEILNCRDTQINSIDSLDYIEVPTELLNRLDQEYNKKITIESVKYPECEGEMISRKGQYGTFWGCKNYPRCKGTRDSQGRSKAEREAEKDKKRSEREWTVE